jgi:diguanylate cyclase (GGDEF)-like protein
MAPLLGVAIAAFLLCWLIDETGLRAVAASLVLGVFYLSAAAALARGWAAQSLLQRFLALAFGLLALAVGARGALVLLAPSGWGWMNNEILRQLHGAALYLLALLGGFGWLLLARERLRDELARQEVVDPLTDVPNRRGFFQALAPWMALARRPGQPTSLVVFDLDGFKRINDGYGHPAGDVVLAALADTCKRQLRDSDLLGRVVGVEFAILLPRTNLDDAAMVAERMRAAIEAQRVKTERALISLTASFGVTTIRADDSTVTLLARADEAMQAAKRAGRNRVELAPPAPAAQAEAEAEE